VARTATASGDVHRCWTFSLCQHNT